MEIKKLFSEILCFLLYAEVAVLQDHSTSSGPKLICVPVGGFCNLKIVPT